MLCCIWKSMTWWYSAQFTTQMVQYIPGTGWYALFWLWWEICIRALSCFVTDKKHKHILVICNNNYLLFLQLQQLLWYSNINVFHCCYYSDRIGYQFGSQINIYFSNDACFIELSDKKTALFMCNCIEYTGHLGYSSPMPVEFFYTLQEAEK